MIASCARGTIRDINLRLRTGHHLETAVQTDQLVGNETQVDHEHRTQVALGPRHHGNAFR
jgi:hypothetical protein